MPRELHFIMPHDHPCLQGHFPGRPVVPGVALLDAMLGRIGPVATLETVRFTGPVLPGERVTLGWSEVGDRFLFTGHLEGRLVLHGRAWRRPQ